MMKFVSNSLEDTKKFACTLAKKLKVGDVVTLEGDLGAGKTTFTKFLAHELGVKDLVSSPTFTIINEYEGDVKIYHMDLYRVENLDEALNTGFLDCLSSKDGICLIEWPQVVKSVLSKKCIKVVITKTKSGREFFVEGL